LEEPRDPVRPGFKSVCAEHPAFSFLYSSSGSGASNPERN
jgi:hypothetical protein